MAKFSNRVGVLPLLAILIVYSDALTPIFAQEAIQEIKLDRVWRDSTGLFSVQAELVELTPMIAKLRLKEGKVAEVRRESLSKADQDFLIELEKSRSPFEKKSTPLVPPAKPAQLKPSTATESKAVPEHPAPLGLSSAHLPPILPTLKNVIVHSQSTQLGKLESTVQSPPTMPVGEAYLADVYPMSRVSQPLLVDADTKTIAFSCSPSIHASRPLQKSLAYVGPLPKGPFELLVESEDPFTLLDHNPETGQTLATGSVLGELSDRDLILVEGLGEGNLREVSRFRLPVNAGSRTQIATAKLVALNQAVLLYEGVIYSWDLSSGKQLYQSDPARRIFSSISFSEDRKLITIPAEGGVHFANARTGEDLGYLSLGPNFASPTGHAAFDPRENRIAYCNSDLWGTYDYKTQSMQPAETTTVRLAGKLVGWAGPDLLLAGDGVLIKTDLRVPIWVYSASCWPSSCLWNDSVTFIDSREGLRVRTLPMPHAPAKAAIAGLPPIEKLLATDRGTAVQLKLELPEPCPENVKPDILRARMSKKIAQAGWTLAENSELQLVVMIHPGKPFKDSYQPYLPGQFNLERKVVEITPMISRLELRNGNDMVWGIQSQNNRPGYGASPKSLEDYVKEREQALPGYFDNIELPVRIPQKPYTFGLGSSHYNIGVWQDSRRDEHQP